MGTVQYITTEVGELAYEKRGRATLIQTLAPERPERKIFGNLSLAIDRIRLARLGMPGMAYCATERHNMSQPRLP